jgi:hypothetical protein
MNKTFYRVADYSKMDLVLNSKSYNYGKGFSQEYDYFLDSYFKVANKIDLPIDFLIHVNNGIALFGNDFLLSIKNAIVGDNFVDIYKVTNNLKHKGIVIPIHLINEFIQSFDDINPFVNFAEGNYLWERYFELVRKKIFNELPSRKESIFLFDNINDCEFYIKNHKKGFGKIYEIEIIQEDALFKADMNIYDETDLSITHNNLLKELFKYWDKQTSKTPRYEYLFQGKCRVKNVLQQRI